MSFLPHVKPCIRCGKDTEENTLSWCPPCLEPSPGWDDETVKRFQENVASGLFDGPPPPVYYRGELISVHAPAGESPAPAKWRF